ncbi:hypothetical protein IW261DRAFT_1427714 [Armillaria novae-zelandiae]|uniref:Uncharacterized protein n=1 Tax=Armillaria novae-zelandiae TaxID=153914 RepID=A0AA39T483_9AGAR|nr:hypothetical protein IW261DRAFT_1427714 [Armillaria novae-zelandiae]
MAFLILVAMLILMSRVPFHSVIQIKDECNLYQDYLNLHLEKCEDIETYFELEHYEIDLSDPHISNWTEPKGLLDIITLGNLILYASALEKHGMLQKEQAALLEWTT